MSRSLDATLRDLNSQRKAVLDDIAAIYEKSADEDAIFDEAYELREGYNNISAEIGLLEMQISSEKHSDPLEVFPPEVWSRIIEDTIQWPLPHEEETWGRSLALLEEIPTAEMIWNLLLLTMVSRSWYEALTNLPTLWTTTVIDETLQDYLALAETTLCLSKSCQVVARLRLSREGWESARPLLSRHRDHIRSLSISTSSRDVFRSILRDISPLISMQKLSITHIPSTFMEELYSLPISQFPALQQLYPPFYHWGPSPWLPPFVEYSIMGRIFSQDDLDSLGLAHRLLKVTILEAPGSLLELSGVFPASLLQLSYSGTKAPRLLSLLQPGLIALQIGCYSLYEARVALQSLIHMRTLQEFKLSVLFLHTDEEIIPEMSEPLQSGSQYSPIRLRLLELYINPYLNRNQYVMLDILHQELHKTCPFVEVLKVEGGKMTPSLRFYLTGLHLLKAFKLTRADMTGEGLISLNSNQMLKTLEWNGTFLSTRKKPALFPFEQTVGAKFKVVAANSEYPAISGEENLSSYIGDSYPFQAYPGPASTSVPAKGPYFYLQELYIAMSNTRGFSTHARDVVESLTLRPYDLPKLSSLGFGNTFVEWDLVILLLERRNISPPAGVSLLQVKDMYNGIAFPSPRLKEAIFPLYLGRYSDREPLSSYSLDAVAARLGDRNQTGCANCCHQLRNCTKLAKDRHNSGLPLIPNNTTVPTVTEEYTLPPESRIACPPLNRQDERWLAGTVDRRRRYHDALKKAATIFSRSFDCRGTGYPETRG